MGFNLHQMHQSNFIPEGIEYLPKPGCSYGEFLTQNEQGILIDDIDLLTPFNVYCYQVNDIIHIQLVEIREHSSNSVVVQFSSEVPTCEYTLPRAMFQACDYVKTLLTKYEHALLSLIFSLFGHLLYESFYDDNDTRAERVRLLYRLAALSNY